MAINFPASLDVLPKPTNYGTARNAPGFEHGTLHTDAATAIERLMAKVGIDGSAAVTSHDWKLARFTFNGTDVTIGAGSVTSPRSALEVLGASGVALRIHADDSAAGATAGLLFETRIGQASNAKAAIIAEGLGGSWGRNKLHLCVNDASDTTAAGIAHARVTILGDGKVGIGRPPTVDLLEVTESFSVWGTIPQAFFRSVGNINVWELNANISDAVNGGLKFLNNSTLRMEIDNSGVNCYMTATASLKRLDVGAVDSGGAGFRMVRVAN